MSALSIEIAQPARTPVSPVRPLRPRRPGPGTSPAVGRARSLPSPVLPRTRTQGCAPTVPVTAGSTWRLTERGIGLVLILAVMIAVAALTVIGLTAVRVTSPSYAGVSAALSR